MKTKKLQKVAKKMLGVGVFVDVLMPEKEEINED